MIRTFQSALKVVFFAPVLYVVVLMGCLAYSFGALGVEITPSTQWYQVQNYEAHDGYVVVHGTGLSDKKEHSFKIDRKKGNLIMVTTETLTITLFNKKIKYNLNEL